MLSAAIKESTASYPLTALSPPLSAHDHTSKLSWSSKVATYLIEHGRSDAIAAEIALDEWRHASEDTGGDGCFVATPEGFTGWYCIGPRPLWLLQNIAKAHLHTNRPTDDSDSHDQTIAEAIASLITIHGPDFMIGRKDVSSDIIIPFC